MIHQKSNVAHEPMCDSVMWSINSVKSESHWCSKTVESMARVLGVRVRAAAQRSEVSQTCLLGLISGDRAGPWML
ncbi:hypothetical protein TNCV_3046281 [Trichonephila clavipes]|uniref:Uncharacterized protein n=1 Tax=Trichonephila clavipes TaxID=2585209 RepID=A0A8X6UW38_TRICX|nr:hypothetical protein TNCV_3046281 [Trichonephila clavipes]